MQFRGLMIGVGLLALLSGALWWTNKNPQDPSKKEGKTKLENLMTLRQAELVRVTVQRKDQEPMVLRKNTSGEWELAVEPKLPTSQSQASDVVTNAATVDSDQVVEENATNLIQFGLEPAQLTIEIEDKTGKKEKLLVGDQAPVGDKFYARRANEKKVYAIHQSYKAGFDRNASDLRDKRLVIVNDAKLTKVELVRKAETLEFAKNGKGAWQMVKPQPYRTEATTVDEIFNQLKEAKFDPAMSAEVAKKNSADFAAATVVGSLRISDGEAVKQLEVRKTKENGYLAKASTVEGIHKASDDLGKSLEKTLDEFRSKKLMDFGFEDPARIQIDGLSKPMVVEHKGEDWIVNGKKMETTSVMPMLDALRAFAALSFVLKGFASPTYTVTVTQKDGKTVEKLMLSKVGNFLYAKREGETGEYEVDPKTWSDLEATLAKVKEAGTGKK